MVESSLRPGAAALALAGLLVAGAAVAQEAGEPLMLRIRPQPDVAAGGPGPDGPESEDGTEALRRAEAVRLAFETRVTVRARRAIASVCTGCLVPDAVVSAVLDTPQR